MKREQAKRRKKARQEQKKKESQSESDKYAKLPQDILDFLQIRIPDKDNVPRDVKKMYNKLCLIYHPDKGGDEEHFKVINNHIN